MAKHKEPELPSGSGTVALKEKVIRKEVADQEDPLTSFFKFASIKCKEYTSERKNQIIKIVFHEIMKE